MVTQLKNRNTYIGIIGALLLCLLIACKTDSKPASENKLTTKKTSVKVPRFNADSAYIYIEKQLAFGPRVPGSEASAQCAGWLADKLKEFGAEVTLQNFKADFMGRSDVEATNIIGVINPDRKNRVLLCAHWDSRAIADKDDERKDEPIAGADDGASGTAALIEIARTIQANPIDLGIDIVLFDAEDQGDMGGGKDETWALGSQYFSRNPHKRNYKADFGILLDMIAAKGARFGKEGISRQYAPQITDKIWKLAQGMGNGHLFQDVATGPINDDHFWVNTILKIPTVDIINVPADGNGSFGFYHHTHDDDINVIDKRNLKSVGQVVTAVIYRHSAESF